MVMDITLQKRILQIFLYLTHLKWNNPPSIFATVHFHFRDIKVRICSRSVNSIEPGHTAPMCSLAWLYTGGKD